MPRHQNDQRTYRGLANYKERVQSFNMAVNKLFEYVRVQIEVDVRPRRTANNIIAARIRTLDRVIDRINGLA